MVAYTRELHDACFRFLDEVEARILLDQLEIFRLKDGEALFRPGDDADHMFIIVDGQMAVLKPTSFEGKMQVVALLGRGAPVGEGALVDANVRNSLVSAVGNSELLGLSKERFVKIQDQSPFLAVKALRWLLGKVGLRLQKNSERLALVL